MVVDMKIQLCGSMTFAKQMKEVKKRLEKQGHAVTIPTNTDDHLKDPTYVDNRTKFSRLHR